MSNFVVSADRRHRPRRRRRRPTANGVRVRGVVDVRPDVRADAGRSGRAHLEARHSRAVCGHRDRFCCDRAVGLRSSARRLHAGARVGSHPFHGTHARGRRVPGHRGRGGRACRHVTGRGPMVAGRATRQTGTSSSSRIVWPVRYEVEGEPGCIGSSLNLPLPRAAFKPKIKALTSLHRSHGTAYRFYGSTSRMPKGKKLKCIVLFRRNAKM